MSIILVLGVLALVGVVLLLTAPEGYEDERGFHFGKAGRR